MRRKREILIQIGLYLIMIIGLIPVIQSLWVDRDDVTTMQENIRIELQNQGKIYSILTDEQKDLFDINKSLEEEASLLHYPTMYGLVIDSDYTIKNHLDVSMIGRKVPQELQQEISTVLKKEPITKKIQYKDEEQLLGYYVEEDGTILCILINLGLLKEYGKVC